MSGIEVVGLVLGILPLAIKALQGYRAMLSGVRGADRDLKALVQDLETEQVRLQTTCEVLLDGIAPLSRIDDMVEKPFGPEWEQFSDNIRERLWKGTGKFKEHAKEMQEAAEELREKLYMEADGKARATHFKPRCTSLLTLYQTNLNSPGAIMKELRRKTSFSLRKKDYEGIIARIKTANSVLHDLAGQNRDLEPSRRRRSQARVTKLIRGLSRSIFDALRSAATCRCVQSHDVCLELVPRKAVLVPSDVEDEVAKNLNFHVVLGSYESPVPETDCSGQDEKRVKPLERPTRWDSLRVQFEPKSELSMKSPSSLSAPLSKPRSPSPRRRVRFRESLGFISRRELTSSSTETLTVVSEKNLVVSTASLPIEALPPVLKSDLCRVIFTWHEERRGPTTERCGYIADPHRTFGLYPQHRHPESSSAVTLRQMLEGKNPEFQELGLLEKLRIALAISMSILHLYDTPWLAGILTLDDVVFLRESQKATSHTDSPLRPFMAKNFVRTTDAAAPLKVPPQNTPRKPSKAMNLTVLSLGAMLIQVMIGQAVPALDMAADSNMDLNAMLEKHEAGGKFSDEVLQSGGWNYMAAVKWCLETESVLGIMGLENEDFCQRFYEAVVARLEKDIQQLNGRYWE
ncbi:hypothetical protein NCS57_01394300 [Fusarium keratoplasticum]|uniref:Uncharacterized protein n=1 Tax=Fusarium keratoplasticum TaxID=1328300 RepID=A0ACC0QED2_9HYPO|nr:hypothetical protein NCS57_01394300 [Fusarium keratoplasticum]KAI8650600.1 hypothetical protein NCS57_01394300 [Fusarium keratoplasticum]